MVQYIYLFIIINKHHLFNLEQPKVLQTLQLPVISLDDCIRVYRNVLPVSERQLCAGGELNKDACRGFGGGPLILPDRSQSSDGILAGKFYQVSCSEIKKLLIGTYHVFSDKFIFAK